MSSHIEKQIVSDGSMINLSSNLRFLMQKKKIDSSELSKTTGIALTTLNGLKRGIGNPTLSTLHSLADYFGITIGQLTESDLLEKVGAKNSKILSEIPLLELSEIDEFLKKRYHCKTTTFVELDNYKSDSCFSVKLPNNSMAPLFEKGTIFVISHEPTCQDGDMVLVRFNNHIPCFRKIFIEDKHYFFSSISEILGDNIVKSNDFFLYGVVVKAIQNFHNT